MSDLNINQPAEKRCKQCETVKPLLDFHKHPGTKDGRQPKCKTCTVEYSRKYTQTYRPQIIERARQRYQANKTSPSFTAFLEAEKQKRLERKRIKEASPTKPCTKCKRELPKTTEYFRACKSKAGLTSACNECDAQIRATVYVATRKARYYRLQTAGLCRECRAPVAEGSTTVCEKHRERNKQRIAQSKATIFTHYGNRCTCCGETEPKFLTIDHVNNDGSSDRKLNNLRGQTTLYTHIIRLGYPDTYQLLCWNCNLGKYHHGGVCPHQFPPPGE